MSEGQPQIDDAQDAARAATAVTLGRIGLPIQPPYESQYVRMRDGIRLALSIWLPEEAIRGARVPIIFMQTRYGRDTQGIEGGPLRWTQEGFALAVVDVRGTAASFGDRTSELAPVQLSDMADLAEYLAARPWSSGEIIATGGSYPGSLADLFTAVDHPAVKGAIVLHSDFDMAQHLLLPGGVLNHWVLDTWRRMTLPVDTGVEPDAAPPLHLIKRPGDLAKFSPVITPVAADPEGSLIREAISRRNRWHTSDFDGVEFRDDRSQSGCSLEEWSPSMYTSLMQAQKKPVQYWGSWVDGGTAEAALARYRSVKAPTEVWISANDHRNQISTDPYWGEHRAPNPDPDERFRFNLDFAKRVLAGDKIQRVINYLPLGEQKFRRTSVWPPADVAPLRLQLSPGGRLINGDAAEGSLTRHMGATQSSGPCNRWTANLGTPALYRDRRNVVEQLLGFEATPFSEDMELAGYVVLKLRLATASTDPIVHAYLDDVSPDGRCTYLTEGILRLSGRAPALPGDFAFDAGPAAHSHRRDRKRAWVPNRPDDLEFAFAPVAARVRAGHALRLSLAAADISAFRPTCPANGDQFEVYCGGILSCIDLPLRKFSEGSA